MRLPLPEVVEDATDQYRQRENWLENFLEACCVLEPEARAPAGDLYQTYREWAQSSGDYVRRDVEFFAAMESKGFQKITPKNRKTWVGLRVDRTSKYGGFAG